MKISYQNGKITLTTPPGPGSQHPAKVYQSRKASPSSVESKPSRWWLMKQQQQGTHLIARAHIALWWAFVFCPFRFLFCRDGQHHTFETGGPAYDLHLHSGKSYGMYKNPPGDVANGHHPSPVCDTLEGIGIGE
uniref:Uncharacterized protein n=1 Tax=Anopheles culicifacies TaxID=139723 RepID=A0A182M3N1_9DIPT